MSLLATVGYALIDRRRAHDRAAPVRQSSNLPTLAQLDSYVWGLLLLGMLFYAIVFPFRSTFSIDYFQGAKGLSLQEAKLSKTHAMSSSVGPFVWFRPRDAR